jgi:hypothetical protein
MRIAIAAVLLTSLVASKSFAQQPAPAPTAPPPAPTEPPPPVANSAPTTVTAGPAPSYKGLSLWGILPWNGIGVGGRFMIPLAIQPLLTNTSIRDSFALEFGADMLHWSYDYALVAGSRYSWTEVVPVIGVMWNLWFLPKLALYPKIELGYAFGWFSDWNYNSPRPTYGGFFWDGTVGALYKLDNGITLRAEAGYAGLKLGAGFLF